MNFNYGHGISGGPTQFQDDTERALCIACGLVGVFGLTAKELQAGNAEYLELMKTTDERQLLLGATSDGLRQFCAAVKQSVEGQGAGQGAGQGTLQRTLAEATQRTLAGERQMTLAEERQMTLAGTLAGTSAGVTKRPRWHVGGAGAWRKYAACIAGCVLVPLGMTASVTSTISRTIEVVVGGIFYVIPIVGDTPWWLGGLNVLWIGSSAGKIGRRALGQIANPLAEGGILRPLVLCLLISAAIYGKQDQHGGRAQIKRKSPMKRTIGIRKSPKKRTIGMRKASPIRSRG